MRSETRGWVTPRSEAAFAWVSLLARMCDAKARIIAERMRRFSASAGVKPRSEKTSVVLAGFGLVTGLAAPYGGPPESAHGRARVHLGEFCATFSRKRAAHRWRAGTSLRRKRDARLPHG